MVAPARQLQPTPARSSEVVFAPPPPSLNGAFGSFCGYRTVVSGGETMRQLPGVRVVFIITTEPGLRVAETANAETTRPFEAFVAGMHDSFAVTESPDVAGGIQVNLAPLAARRMLGIPLDTIANRVVSLDDLLGPGVHELRERIIETNGWDERFRLIGGLLERRAEGGPEPDPGVRWAWHQLMRSRGKVPIGEIGAELGWSRKRLVAAFRDQAGMPPKMVARILRFEHAAGLLNTGAAWPEIVDSAGYFDQSHFIREFSEFAGTTPTEHLAARRALGLTES